MKPFRAVHSILCQLGLLAVPASIVLGCGEVTVPSNAKPVVFEVLDGIQARGFYGDFDRDRVVITDEAAFNEFWRLVASPQGAPAPVMDFAQRTVVAASMGTRGGSGYEIAVTDVLEHDATYYIVVEEISPGPKCLTLATSTWPMVAVVVSAAAADVEFVERERTVVC